MIYVQESLVPEEKIVYAAQFHWMYTVSACFWLVIGLILGWFVLYSGILITFQDLPSAYYTEAVWELNPMIRFAALGMVLFGILKCSMMMAFKATTEIAITTRRLIFKRGIVARHVDEMSIDRVEGVIVEQGVLGRIFQYGRVIVRGMGVGAIVLPGMLITPIMLRKAIEKAREI